MAVVGLCIIIVFLAVGIIETIFFQAKWHVGASADTKSNPNLPGYLAPYAPNEVNYELSPTGLGSPPSSSHPFGTDYLGRDMLSRTLVATRISMLVGVIAVAIAMILGLSLGPFSGYYGGFVDSVIMRIADIFFAFPYILFVLLMMTVLGPGLRQRLHRHRRARLGDVRARRPRAGADRQVDGVRGGGARPGRR